MYRTLKLFIKLNLPHLDAVFALLEKKKQKTIRYIYHYTNLTFVCDVTSVRAGGHGKPFDPSSKHFLFSSSLDLDDT